MSNLKSCHKLRLCSTYFSLTVVNEVTLASLVFISFFFFAMLLLLLLLFSSIADVFFSLPIFQVVLDVGSGSGKVLCRVQFFSSSSMGREREGGGREGGREEEVENRLGSNKAVDSVLFFAVPKSHKAGNCYSPLLGLVKSI